MKLVMTLLARNEADIVDAQLAFHLNAGVDFVIATDNASDDGTTEILERYERAGRLHLIHEQSDDMRQGEWVTRMARLASTEFGADWVINSDADEFWWPRGGTLKDVLADGAGALRRRAGMLAALPAAARARRGVLRERMTMRLCEPASPGDKETIFHAHQKVAHRASRDVEVEDGNHNVDAARGLEPLRSWHPIEVLHFSLRSRRAVREQESWRWLRSVVDEPCRCTDPASQAGLRRRPAGLERRSLRRFLVDDEALATGTCRRHARDRHATARCAPAARECEEGGFAVPEPGARSRLSFPAPDVAEIAAFAARHRTLVEIDGIVRAEARVDALEERLEALERRGRLPRALAVRASRLTHRRRLAPR